MGIQYIDQILRLFLYSNSHPAFLAMPEKLYVSYNSVHKICKEAAARCLQRVGKPDVIVAIGGGGFIPARILRTFLRHEGEKNIPIQAIGLSLYEDMGKGEDTIGKEVIRTKYGKFRSIKFRPLLIKGTIFEGGEKMTVWVSDDANHIPLRVESPISVGSIKVDMMDFRNRRYPLSSLMDVR